MFRKRPRSVQDLLKFFNLSRPWDVAWVHRVNNKEELSRLCASENVTFIEGDISLSKDLKRPVMKHPPEKKGDAGFEKVKELVITNLFDLGLDFIDRATVDAFFEDPSILETLLNEIKDDSIIEFAIKQLEELKYKIPLVREFIVACEDDSQEEFSFVSWLTILETYKKGAKIDFKDPRAVVPTLKLLKKIKPKIPIVLNADVVEGPGNRPPIFNGYRFVELCKKYYPKAILSLGSTIWYDRSSGYTEEMVEQFLEISKKWKGDVSFCIWAPCIKSLWPHVNLLLKDPHHSLTLWNTVYDWDLFMVRENLIDWIKENVDPTCTFYDIINSKGKNITIY